MTKEVTRLINEHPVMTLKKNWGCIYECANANAGDIPAWEKAAAGAGFAP